MYMLHLFDRDDAVDPIDVRLHAEGRLRVGRDRAADWAIVDPEQLVSRAHLELLASDEGLTLVSVGANGVFDGATGVRFPDHVPVDMAVPCSLRVGRFRIAATRTGRGAPGTTAITPLGAFCTGAGLEPSAFKGEDQLAVIERAGRLYRELVGGLLDLTARRDADRAGYHLERTMPPGLGGTPQRLASDLLAPSGTGRLPGPVAVRAAFADLSRHARAVEAGRRAALGPEGDRIFAGAYGDAAGG